MCFAYAHFRITSWMPTLNSERGFCVDCVNLAFNKYIAACLGFRCLLMDTDNSVLIRAQEGDCIWLHGQQSSWSQLREFVQSGNVILVCQQQIHAEALPRRVLFQRWRQTMSAAVNHCGLPIGWRPMCLQSSSIPLRTSDRPTKFLCNLCGLSKKGHGRPHKGASTHVR